MSNSVNIAKSMSDRLAEIKKVREDLESIRKMAFMAAPPMPPGGGGAPPMDPAMMQGGPPMDPAMMQGGMPPVDPATGMPMDPAMMQGGMPPDPAMMQGGPPMDPAAGGPITPEMIDEIVGIIEGLAANSQQMEQALQQMSEQVEQALQQLGQQLQECVEKVEDIEQGLAQMHAPAGGGAGGFEM